MNPFIVTYIYYDEDDYEHENPHVKSVHFDTEREAENFAKRMSNAGYEVCCHD